MTLTQTVKWGRSKVPAFAATVSFVVLSAPPVGADDKSSCVASYEQSQVLRRELALGRAREELRNCSRAACPALVRTDCINWLEQVESEFPSLAIRAVKNDQDVADVRVFEDSAEIATRLDGSSLEVEPGEHTFRFESEGASPVVLKLVVREREKDRPVPVAFVSLPSRQVPQRSVRTSGASPVHPGIFALGGLGVAGIAAFAVLGLVGKGDENSLSNSCSPNCSPGSVDKVRTEYITADVALGVGAAALVSGAIWYFISQKPVTGTASFHEGVAVAPRGGGAILEWNGTL